MLEVRGQLRFICYSTVMTLVLMMLLALYGLELSLLLRWPNSARSLLPWLIILGNIAASLLLVWRFFNLISLAILLLSIYRSINVGRFIKSGQHAKWLQTVFVKSASALFVFQIALFCLAWLADFYAPTISFWLSLLIFAQICLSVILVTSTRRHLRTTLPIQSSTHLSDGALPTVTVAIPARNETDSLKDCLGSLVSSDYPKLEILVLDDCSQIRQTPEIIKSFAQDGVRFIAGTPPPDHWLPKNFAYQQLTQAASGEVVLFCGADTRFRVDSIRNMIEVMLARKKSMLSIIPRNNLGSNFNTLQLLIQPSRYAWELALPRRLFNKPPVLSTCWLIASSLLHQAGDFKAIAQSSSIESYFAKQAVHDQDGYSFLQTANLFGLTSSKTPEEQRETAIRVRYPQLHRRLELVGLIALIELVTLLLPYVLVLVTALTHRWLFFELSFLVLCLITNFYSQIVTLTFGSFIWRSLCVLPIAVIYDVCLLHYSLWQYEFGMIMWKGRNVCLPIMTRPPLAPKNQ